MSTTSSYHLCKQPPHSSTAFQTSMSSFIYHILLSLTDLSLIYSCRLHDQSICHATRSINLHTSCIFRDQKSTYQLHNWSTHIPAACSAIGEPAYQLCALWWGNLHTCWPRNWSTHIPAAWSETEESAYQLHNWSIYIPAGSVMGNLLTSYTIDQSAYQLHTPRPGNLPISHVIGQSMS